ncbi:enoyl-CoA hydratase domain-containing protein 3, mitochondrial isoform X3 [Lepisosteus oculatus]|uniref:enoyl-CoA hydratase domain-containing protein 3, mitochondrial isoform X3 n=1 Tax=Lepisosteus oculatus TaxID=7918 RepID=UPI003717027D
MANRGVAFRLFRCKEILLRSGLRLNSSSLASGGLTRSFCAQTRSERLTVRLQQDGIRNIILNDPKRRNTLSLSMLNSLRTDILHEIDSDDLRVIIISAEGPVFSSGHDLKELTLAQGPEHHSRVFEVCSEIMTLIQDIPVPVIAKVALEMLFTGNPISAQDALLHGLVSKVVPAEKLDEETLAIARKVCAASRPVVALGKQTFYRQMAQDRSAAYATASRVMVDNLALRDGQEGIKAFIEKRRPEWTHSRDRAHE